jgi:Xaa-Pro aminopeptidase
MAGQHSHDTRATTTARATTDDYGLTASARRSMGRMVTDHGAGQIDMVALRGYRLGRLQAELKRRGVPAFLLSDPINMRYAAGVRNMQPWSLHSSFRTAFVPAEGKVVLFEYAGSEHLASGLETVAEVRPATTRFWAGEPESPDRHDERKVRIWAAQIAELLRAHGGDTMQLAIDRHVDHFSARILEAAGITLMPAQKMLASAQSIKSPEEVACMSISVSVAEAAIYRLREALEPGMTEIALWSILERTNVEMGGEYMDTRLLSSGGRTNPWYQEATDRIVRPGDLVALDTDMIGPFGYDADISRTLFCPPGRPSDEQRRLYSYAWEQLQHNLQLIRPGAAFREMSESAYLLPEEFRSLAIPMTWHGVGLYGQWPTIVGRGHFAEKGTDGIVQPGMTLCCESYVADEHGVEGVKLEQQVLVTEAGFQLLSTFPFEENLLGREI